MYHNEVTLSLIPIQRLGNQAQNCKMDYWKRDVFLANMPSPVLRKTKKQNKTKRNDEKTKHIDRKTENAEYRQYQPNVSIHEWTGYVL